MTPLQQKIKNTSLFSPSEKVDVILALEQMTDDQKTQMETVIDEYDSSHKTLVKEFTEETKKDLSTLENKADGEKNIQNAVDLMKKGLEEILR